MGVLVLLCEWIGRSAGVPLAARNADMLSTTLRRTTAVNMQNRYGENEPDYLVELMS
jgi:hypothetical protein